MKKQFTPEHHIQVAILNGLRYADSVRFTDLKPTKIESNLFMYHMRQLIRGGLVDKTDLGYGLSEAGKTYLARSSSNDLSLRVQPTILSVVLVRDPATNQWLATKRLHQPFLNTVGFPSGKIHEGETFAEAAAREAEEKLNLSNLNLIQKGVFELRYWQETVVSRHIIGFVSYAEAKMNTAYSFSTSEFTSSWVVAADLVEANVFPQHKALMTLCQQPGTFMKSFDVR